MSATVIALLVMHRIEWHAGYKGMAAVWFLMAVAALGIQVMEVFG